MTRDDAADALSLIALLTYSLLFDAYTVVSLRPASNRRSQCVKLGVSPCCVRRLRIARLRAMATFTNVSAAGKSRNQFGDSCK